MTNVCGCGAELAENAKYCGQCGTAVEQFSGVNFLRQAKTVACQAADDIIDGGESIVTSDLGQKMAAGAAVGALCVAPIPIIGWAAGAAVGAGLVAFKHLNNKA